MSSEIGEGVTIVVVPPVEVGVNPAMTSICSRENPGQEIMDLEGTKKGVAASGN